MRNSILPCAPRWTQCFRLNSRWIIPCRRITPYANPEFYNDIYSKIPLEGGIFYVLLITTTRKHRTIIGTTAERTTLLLIATIMTSSLVQWWMMQSVVSTEIALASVPKSNTDTGKPALVLLSILQNYT